MLEVARRNTYGMCVHVCLTESDECLVFSIDRYSLSLESYETQSSVVTRGMGKEQN